MRKILAEHSSWLQAQANTRNGCGNFPPNDEEEKRELVLFSHTHTHTPCTGRSHFQCQVKGDREWHDQPFHSMGASFDVERWGIEVDALHYAATKPNTKHEPSLYVIVGLYVCVVCSIKAIPTSFWQPRVGLKSTRHVSCLLYRE